MRSRLRAAALVMSVMALAAAGRPGQAQQVGGQVSGLGRGIYGNPALQPYAWPRASTGNDAFLFFLASQYQAARMARAEQESMSTPSGPSASRYHQMQPGGSSASTYFGRRTPMPSTPGTAAPARFNRLGGHFGNRGR
ncbi:hypothetical protein [Tautonia plasticadhaerens]|uniref:Uncharacterized protein n=1 Tax=Tautonia plasticadhaerens TaxID=2527974 RepID=A0A518H8A8_9BACT|nr:hypothetical protein [Tautonia plasticadhaerens]QDV37089.1 hypothetical protein ElP_50220 [Tautonia plasticadhaerens]